MWFGLAVPATVSSVTFSQNPIEAGQTTGATVTLSNLAPAGGALVTLTVSPASAGTIPPTLTIPAGQQTGNFQVTNTSVPQGVQSASLQVTASYAGSSVPGTLIINAQVVRLMTVTFSPNPVVAGQSAKRHSDFGQSRSNGWCVVRTDSQPRRRRDDSGNVDNPGRSADG
jgi:hypothetical protein